MLFVYLLIAPSRDLDLRQQLPSLDESLAEPKYRTPSPANFLGELCYLFLSTGGAWQNYWGGKSSRKTGFNVIITRIVIYHTHRTKFLWGRVI